MIKEIEKAIKEIYEKDMNPNTIRLHPLDVLKLKKDSINVPNIKHGKILTVLGLKIIEITKVKKGTAEIYDDRNYFEVKL